MRTRLKNSPKGNTPASKNLIRPSSMNFQFLLMHQKLTLKLMFKIWVKAITSIFVHLQQ